MQQQEVSDLDKHGDAMEIEDSGTCQGTNVPSTKVPSKPGPRVSSVAASDVPVELGSHASKPKAVDQGSTSHGPAAGGSAVDEQARTGASHRQVKQERDSGARTRTVVLWRQQPGKREGPHFSEAKDVITMAQGVGQISGVADLKYADGVEIGLAVRLGTVAGTTGVWVTPTGMGASYAHVEGDTAYFKGTTDTRFIFPGDHMQVEIRQRPESRKKKQKKPPAKKLVAKVRYKLVIEREHIVSPAAVATSSTNDAGIAMEVMSCDDKWTVVNRKRSRHVHDGSPVTSPPMSPIPRAKGLPASNRFSPLQNNVEEDEMAALSQDFKGMKSPSSADGTNEAHSQEETQGLGSAHLSGIKLMAQLCCEVEHSTAGPAGSIAKAAAMVDLRAAAHVPGSQGPELVLSEAWVGMIQREIEMWQSQQKTAQAVEVRVYEEACIVGQLEAARGGVWELKDCGGGGSCGILVINDQLVEQGKAPIDRGELCDYALQNPHARAHYMSDQGVSMSLGLSLMDLACLDEWDHRQSQGQVTSHMPAGGHERGELFLAYLTRMRRPPTYITAPVLHAFVHARKRAVRVCAYGGHGALLVPPALAGLDDGSRAIDMVSLLHGLAPHFVRPVMRMDVDGEEEEEEDEETEDEEGEEDGDVTAAQVDEEVEEKDEGWPSQPRQRGASTVSSRTPRASPSRSSASWTSAGASTRGVSSTTMARTYRAGEGGSRRASRSRTASRSAPVPCEQSGGHSW